MTSGRTALLATCILLAPAWAQPPALVFTHATVIDTTGGPEQHDTTVVVTGNRISALGKNVKIPKNAQVLDATGKFLIPGLWDMHTHIHSPEDLQLFIANGVTGLRVMAALPEVSKMRSRIDSGDLVGSRMTIASRLMDGESDPNQPAASWNPSETEIAQEWTDVMKGGRPRSIIVHNAAEGREAVINAKRAGAEFIKVHEDLSREAYFAIAQESRKQGILFVGHVPPLVTALEASDAGQRSIEHLQNILIGCSTRETELLQMAAEHGASIATIQRATLETFSPQKAVALIARFKKNETWQCPTLTSRFSTRGRAERSSASLDYISSQIRSRWQRALNAAPQPTEEEQAIAKSYDQKLVELVALMRRQGVRFIAGTDVGGAFLVPGFSFHDELAELVKAGFTPMEALQAATIDAARFRGQEKEQGSIQRGKLADLVLLNADPLDNIANTRKIDAVVVNGRLLDRKTLDANLAQVKTAAANN